MKAKKPLVLTVLILALLAVVMIMPTAASGASDNQPINWATHGENTNYIVHPFWQGKISFNVRELPDNIFTGYLQTQTVRHYGGSLERASSFEAVEFGTVNDPLDPQYGLPYIKFVAETKGKLWIAPGVQIPFGERVKIYAVDGGTASAADYMELWEERDPVSNWGIDDDWPEPPVPTELYSWIPYGEIGTGNLVVHLGE